MAGTLTGDESSLVEQQELFFKPIAAVKYAIAQGKKVEELTLGELEQMERRAKEGTIIMIYKVPFELRGMKSEFVVEYRENIGPEVSGLDILLDLGFDPGICTSYPSLHAYFEDMNMPGCRRYCGWIQLVERQEFDHSSSGQKITNSVSVDVSDDMRRAGVPYYAFGFPAEMYDAPCRNLGNHDRLIWTAYTYLVDMPSRANHGHLSYLAGFSWGYEEDKKGPVRLLDFNVLSEEKWRRHYKVIEKECPVAFAR